MGNGHMGPPPPHEYTDACENITFPQLLWWAVTSQILSHNMQQRIIWYGSSGQTVDGCKSGGGGGTSIGSV